MNLRRLKQHDAIDSASATGVLLLSADYRLQTFGNLPVANDANTLFEGFPQACTADDSFVYAIQDRDSTLGLLQVARYYPAPDVAYIGLLLLKPEARKHHQGCKAIEHFAQKARTWSGIQRLQLSVLDANASGIQFWRHCGFRTVATDCKEAGMAGNGRVMERALKAKPACKGGRIERDENAAYAQHLSALLR